MARSMNEDPNLSDHHLKLEIENYRHHLKLEIENYRHHLKLEIENYGRHLETLLRERPKKEYLDDLVVPHLSNDWNEVGANLDIQGPVLGRVKREHHNIPEKCASNMFDEWLEHSPGTGRKERTWKTVLTSLRDSGREDIVENVTDHFTWEGIIRVMNEMPNKADLRSLVIQQIARMWRAVGRLLGISSSTLKYIEERVKGDTLQASQLMFDLWLNGAEGTGDEKRTWCTIIRALVQSGLSGLAEDVVHELCPETAQDLKMTAIIFGITSTSRVNDVEVTISLEKQPISCDTRGSESGIDRFLEMPKEKDMFSVNEGGDQDTTSSGGIKECGTAVAPICGRKRACLQSFAEKHVKRTKGTNRKTIVFLRKNHQFIKSECDFRNIATNLLASGVITHFESERLLHSISEQANQEMYLILERSPSLEKLAKVADALATDETHDPHQELVKRIREFIATDCTEDVAKETLDDEGFERDKLLGSISECKENVLKDNTHNAKLLAPWPTTGRHE